MAMPCPKHNEEAINTPIVLILIVFGLDYFD